MARGDYPSAKQDQFMLRFPEGLRDEIRRVAAANNRSMNAEIIATLEAAYPTMDVLDALLDEMGGIVSRYREGGAKPGEYKTIAGYAVSLQHYLEKMEEDSLTESVDP